MAQQSHSIVPLEKPQLSEAGQLLARAFHDDALSRFLLPDASKRMVANTWLFHRFAQYSLYYGALFTTDDLAGVSSWVRPAYIDITLFRMMRCRMLTLPLKLGRIGYRRFKDFMKSCDHLHKQVDKPHWYLAILGVDPSRQRQGIGRALLTPGFDLVDRDNLPCYLETVTPEHVTYYERNGFRVIGKASYTANKMIWGMLRPPQAK